MHAVCAYQAAARAAAEAELATVTSTLQDLHNSMTVMTEERDLARSKEEEYFLELEVRALWATPRDATCATIWLLAVTDVGTVRICRVSCDTGKQRGA